MVRLTAQLINMSTQKHNAVRDWELDLRGYRIPIIENLGATMDQFDTIDFTDNDIRKLDKFPLLKRLKHILLSNNRIVRISDHLEETLPSLETLVLTNNGLKELSDIDPLATITTLKNLSLLGNPIAAKKVYRFYVIHKIPSLRVLDFCRIKQNERDIAARLFKKKKVQQPAENGTQAKTFTPGDKIPHSRPAPIGLKKNDIAAIRKAIANAKTLEEIERLNQLLKAGQIPQPDGDKSKRRGKAEPKRREDFHEEEEEEEDNQASGYSRKDEEENEEEMEEN